MKQEHLQIIEKSILDDKARLQEVDTKKEIENIDKMLNIFKNYETELVNLNLELLKPYLEEENDVLVTLEFIQCLLLGNINNQLDFELDEEQRGLLVWICRLLETKRQELSLTPKLSSEEKYQIEQRLKINEETYDILLNKPDVYLSSNMITSLASTVSLTKEKLFDFYQDLIERNNQIYLKEKEPVKDVPKTPNSDLIELTKENDFNNISSVDSPSIDNIVTNNLEDNINEEENVVDITIEQPESNLEEYLSQIEDESEVEEYLTEEEIKESQMDLEDEYLTEDELQEDLEEYLTDDETNENQEALEEQIEEPEIEKYLNGTPKIIRNENLKEPAILKSSSQILETYNLNNKNDELFEEEPILKKLKNKTKELIISQHLKEHTKEILNVLKENNFMKITDYLLDDLIIYSSKQIIENVFKIASQENISSRTLEQIPSVFLNKTSPYQENNNYGNFSNFVNNIKTLKENNIDLAKVAKNSLAILTIDYNKLIKNIQVAKLYKIPFINKANHEEYNFLLANNLADNIDRYIEMGLEIYAKEKTAKLINPDNIMFYRLYFANQKHLQYICQFEKNNSYIWLDKEINNQNGFGITKENYLEKTETIILPKQEMYEQIINNNNLINKEILNHPFIKELENYRFNNQNYYQINSIKISRLKVLRIFNTLISNEIPTKDALLYAVIYNTILNEKQFSTLRQAIDEICEEKVI